MSVEIRQTDEFADWFAQLRDRQARARITARIRRLSLGNPGDVKPVGSGVSEMRIDYGPGYRVYYVARGSTAGRPNFGSVSVSAIRSSAALAGHTGR